MIVLGIDPGAAGGIAVLGAGPPQAWPMPATPFELLELLREFGPTEADRAAGIVQADFGQLLAAGLIKTQVWHGSPPLVFFFFLFSRPSVNAGRPESPSSRQARKLC